MQHPAEESQEIFNQAQDLITARRYRTGPRERFRTRHVYVLSCRLWCAICERKMQGHWANESAYYRCRFPAEYALANHVSHPLNVFVREREVLPELDAWLAREFAPHRLAGTIDDLAAAQADLRGDQQAATEARATIEECDAKMTRYREAIDAGADVTEVTSWINAAKATRIRAEAVLRASAPTQRRMTRQEIAEVIEHFAGLVTVIRNANPADKAEIYKGLNLALTYQPETPTIRATVQIASDQHGVMVGVRGGIRQLRTWVRSPASCWWERSCERAGGSVDPPDNDRLRGHAGGDRGHGVVSAYA